MANPKPIITPFAENGTRNEIPEAGADQPQKATMSGGWGAVTQTPINEGGIPPERADFNGLGHLTTSHLAFLNRGQWYGYDATFSGQIGGYPLHSRLQLDNGDIVKSTIPNNTNDPNTNMAGWSDEKNSTHIVDLSYMNLPIDTDISEILKDALSLASIRPIEVILPCGEFTMTRPVAGPLDSKGISLNLNGSTLKPTADYSSPDWYLLDIRSTTSHPVIIKNGVIDGSLRKQNLFEYTNIQDFFRDATSGIFAEAIDIIFENFTLKHLYGQTTKVNCRNLEVTNVGIFDCGGHWYTTDGYDLFGDLFYIGTGWNTTGKISASFKNVVGIAKKSTDYPENHQAESPLTQVMYSRAGLVLERLGGNENEVDVVFDNCSIQFVERGFHQEIKGITSRISISNSRFDSCVLFGAYLTDTMHGYASNSQLGFYGSAYAGSKGLSRGFDGTSYVTLRDNCIVTYFGDDDCQIFGTAGNLDAKDCKFKNVTGLWATGSQIKLENCEVEVSKHSTLEYPSWNTAWVVKNSSINYVGSDQVFKAYTQSLYFTLSNVSFDNIFFGVDSLDKKLFKDCSLTINVGNNLDLKGTMWKLYDRNGKILNYPSIYWGVNKAVFDNDRYTYQKYQKPSSGTLNIINDAIRTVSNRSSLFLIVAKAHDSGVDLIQNISDTAYALGYYVAVAKKDASQTNGVKILTPFTSVGSTDSAGFNITIDQNGDVTAYGTYSSWVHVAVVPNTEKYTLPFVPDSIINL